MSAQSHARNRKLAIGGLVLAVTLGLGAYAAHWFFYRQPPSGVPAANGGDDHGEHDEDHEDHEGHSHDESGKSGHDDQGHNQEESGDDGHGHGDHEHERHEHEESQGGEHVDTVRLTPAAVRRWGIRVEPASRHDLASSFTAPARVGFNLERVAHVGSSVQGRVRELRARVGDEVKQGDVLMVIDSAELGGAQSEFLQKWTAAAAAEPAVELAKSTYERASNLYEESQGIALTEVQRREAEYKAAEGALLNAEAEATAAENRLHLLGMSQEAVNVLRQTGEIDPLYNVRAAIGGRVIEREATLGEMVGPDREALLVLADMSTLWVLVDVPEAKMSGVRVGAQARISVPAVRGRVIEGVVSYISPQLDPATRAVSVRVELKDKNAELRPGMFAQAEIVAQVVSRETPGGGEVLAVPEGAIQVVEGESCVFVPVGDEPNTFAKRVVRAESAIGGMVPIVSGLKEREAVVVSGSFILKAELGKAGAAHEH